MANVGKFVRFDTYHHRVGDGRVMYFDGKLVYFDFKYDCFNPVWVADVVRRKGFRRFAQSYNDVSRFFVFGDSVYEVDDSHRFSGCFLGVLRLVGLIFVIL